MTETLVSREARRGAWLPDWGIAIAAVAVDVVTTFLPRADKAGTLRGELRATHMILGLVLLALCAWRLWRWRRGMALRGAVALPPLVSGWISALVAALLVLLCLNPLIGAVSGWSMALLPGQGGGTHVVLNRPIWLFSTYFHAAFGVGMLLLKVAMVLTGLYTLLRYRAGLLSAFPRAFGVLAFFGLSVSLFALSTFRSYERGPIVVGGFWLLCLLAWGLSSVVRRPIVRPVAARSPAWPGAIVALLVALGMYGPYAMFRVSPFEAAATGGPPGVTWHESPAIVEKLPPETPYERKVRLQTFKWCAFCHAMKKGADNMAGPNLYGVFGQRIASAPNFAYGETLRARGAKGEVWNDAALDALLADPDAFAPGTAMVISSGNITDPRERAALIAILKRETGSAGD